MKRRLPTIVILMLLGAIVNVAVAWAGNIEQMQRGSTRRAGGGYFAPNDVWIEFERSDALICTNLMWSYGFPNPTLDEARRQRLRSAPYWSAVASLPGYTYQRFDESHAPGVHQERGSGFPLVSMVLYGRYKGADVEYITPVIRLPDRVLQVYGTTVRVERLLPLRPYWPGFAINTVFYAFILWLLFAGPFVLRRRRRIRRGLCPKCAYDLRGTPGATACPECGELQ